MKRLWGIRHIRYFFAQREFWIWWTYIGQHLGAVPNESDLQHLKNIWEGKA